MYEDILEDDVVGGDGDVFSAAIADCRTVAGTVSEGTATAALMSVRHHSNAARGSGDLLGPADYLSLRSTLRAGAWLYREVAA